MFAFFLEKSLIIQYTIEVYRKNNSYASMKLDVRCFLITTIILIFSNPVFSFNYRGGNCPIVIAGNCQIDSGDSYMENNSESYLYNSNGHGIIPGIYQSSHFNYSLENDGYNNYFGDGMLEFAVSYLSDYDRDMYYGYYYFDAPDVDNMNLPSNQFNHNIGISPNQRLDTLKLTSYTNGSFRINGNVYLNNLEYDPQNTAIANGTNIAYSDATYVGDTSIDYRYALNRSGSTFASNIFDVTNPILPTPSYGFFAKAQGLSFLFDDSNDVNKIINAQFGNDSNRFEIISIENNRNIADSEINANFNRNIYAEELQLRTELESINTQNNIAERVASAININFNNITANINNINLGINPPSTDNSWISRIYAGPGSFPYIEDNYTASAPYSQLAGSLTLNDSNVTTENFNLGDHGTLKINTSGNSGITATNNMSFTNNSRIIISNNSLLGDVTNHIFLTSSNNITNADNLIFDTIDGSWSSSTPLTVNDFSDIIEINGNTDLLYDVNLLFFDNGSEVSGSSPIDEIAYNMTVKSTILPTKSHNDLLSAILHSSDDNLAIIRNSLHNKNNITELNEFADRLLNTNQQSRFMDIGYVANKSNNIIGNRIFDWMVNPNANDNTTNSNLNFQDNLALQNNIIAIANKTYSGHNNRINSNFSDMNNFNIINFAPDEVMGLWVKPFGGIYNFDGDNAFDANIYGILTGIDKKFYNRFNHDYRSLIGLSYGYFVSNFDADNGSESTNISNQISLYNANYHNSGLGLFNKNILGITYNENDIKRLVADGATELFTAKADYNNMKYNLSSSIGYVADIAERFLISAEAMIGYNYFDGYNYTETDAGILNMTVDNDGYGSLISDFSLKISGKHKDWKVAKKKYKKNKKVILIFDKYIKGYVVEPDAYSFKPSISFSWLRNYNNKPKGSSITFEGLTTMNTVTPDVNNITKDIYSADFGIEILKLSSSSVIDLSYKIETGEDYIGHSAYAKYAIKF
ncbi:autotransporter outer membrane beta-barrel domain-containing protein [Rickettsiales bacterium]|nr:autotransporter outer membrane beta-barrel domain-containing protein [Rickettsiales bacterium]